MPGSIVKDAYAVDDSGNASTTISVTINGVAAGNMLVAHVGWGGVAITATVSDGTAYVNADGPRTDTSNDQRGQVFFKENSGSGNFVVTATFSSSVPYRRLRVCEVSGIQTSASLDRATGQWQSAPGTGIDAVTSGVAAPTTNATDFLMGFTQNTSEVDPGTGTLNAGTNYTKFGTQTLMGLEFRSVVTTGAYAATFTHSVANSRVTHFVAFKEFVDPSLPSDSPNYTSKYGPDQQRVNTLLRM